MKAAPGTQPRFHVRVASRSHRVFWLVAALPLLFIVAGPWWASRSTMHLVAEFAYMLTLAQMWNLLAGYGGTVSIGQQAYIGIGGYAMLVFAVDLDGNPFLGILFGGAVAAVAAMIIAPVVFRLRGAYFAIGTWVVAEVLRLVIANIPAVGGGSGTSLTSSMAEIPAWLREATTYWIALGLGVGSTLMMYLLLLSRPGLGLTAMRDSEVASESLGLRVRVLRLVVYVAAGLGCGLAGGLIYVSKLRIAPDSAFSVDWAAGMIFIVVLGGIGTLEGPVIGTLVFLALRSLLADYGTWYLIALGAVAIVAMRWAPGGIWGFVSRRFDLYLFPVQRRIGNPVDAPADEGGGGAG